MNLSNTATPKYYGEFRDKVLSGQLPVCKEVSMEMNRIDALIADPHIYYDPSKVEGWIRFCENEMTLTDGSDLHLLPTFKLWAEQVYGWYYFVERIVYQPDPDGRGGRYVKKRIKKRLTREQYLILGRGGAKSLYASLHQAYELTCNVATTQQIVTAPTMKQAEETLGPIRTAITRARGAFFKFLTQGSIHNTTGDRHMRQQLASTKKGIENQLTNSIIMVLPMDVDKLQGYKPTLASVDEWLSGDTRENPISALVQGAAKNESYLLLATSSEGTVRNGIGDSIKIELMKLLKGEYYDPGVSIWWYKLDDIKEVADPSTWVKAQPNIGMTVSYETYQLEVEKAERAPATRNDTLAKRFGIPTEGYTYFFTYEETKRVPYKKEYYKQACSLGADLSQGDDFCAFTFIFPQQDGSFGVKSRCYITERTLLKLPAAMRELYNDFLNEGSLIVMDGVVLDIDRIYDELDRYILDCNYDIRSFGYDPYNADKFVNRWTLENVPYGIEKVIQGARTETVPLGELKILAEDRCLVFDQKIMQYCMGNCITLEDTNGNRKLSKIRRDQKIDAVSAMMDAYIAYKEHKDLYDF